MNKYYGLLALFATIFVSGCKNKNEIKTIDIETEVENLNGFIQFPIFTKLAADIFEIDSFLIVSTPFEPQSILSIYSKKDGQVIGTFGKRGKGPDEFTQPHIYQLDNKTLSLWDVNRKYAEIYIEENRNKDLKFSISNRISIKDGGMKLIRFSSNRLISIINSDGMFSLFNNNGELVGKSFGENPLKINNNEYDRFQGYISILNFKNIFVFGTSNLGYLCAYEIDREDKPLLKWEIYLHQKPFYELINNKIKWDKEKHLQGIKDLQIHNDKILVLYSGKSISLPGNTPEGALSNTLFLLDINGKLLKKYNLDIPILKFHFSGDDNAIYGISMSDDWQIVKYNFPN
jgi:hypothetical protein